MWREVFRIAAAAELGLVGIAQCFDLAWLPLAGGHIQQIAVLFIFAFVALEGSEAIRGILKKGK
ncbi:hypothetical protein OOZ63_27940 [Paucibacter sp. PLA-PC-4]|uniref:hypothetical protein n=1 Tax=Paucibacter sp. PLA-PC-4 TaxID=2993655 RepID=UPI00224B38D0|nr:hypothetical protein [Paucibacter sp. PLA-PC-4]MCX2865658.1 hypothetical protein [Paucibacter sp. PLA-PC-4]